MISHDFRIQFGMMSRLFSYSFVWVIIACGVVALIFAVGNFSVLGFNRYPAKPYKYLVDADPERGRVALVEYGCVGCHVIPGMKNATGRVGPKLDEIADQIYIGGVLANDPENMVRWIRDPVKYSPQTAMPDLGVSELDARNIAAYLYQN